MTEAAWWNNVVFYEIFVRSFYDSSGDGIGDLDGLIQTLDYLNDGDPQTTEDLGIGAVALMPVTASPSYHGYDTVDYYRVAADYGSNAQFHTFIEEAHKRGIRVVVDIPFNHTSGANAWFADASSSPDAAYRDFYIWRDEDPGFPGPQGQTVWHPLDGHYYYGLHGPDIPDLNYNNPVVTEQMYAVVRFWLEEMEVDGLRLDGVQYLIEEEDIQEHTTATLSWLVAFARFVNDVAPERLIMGEIWNETSQVAPYVQQEALDLASEVTLAESVLLSINTGFPGALRRSLSVVLEAYPPGSYATFLSNHNLSRVMSQVGGSQEKAHLAATTLLTLPGVPFIYYGEEIGMRGEGTDRQVLSPMQWAAIDNAFFTAADQPWTPVNEDYETVNVAAGLNEPDSLLNHYRRLIYLRNQHVALRQGGLLTLESNCNPVFAFLRHYPGNADLDLREEGLLVFLNFSTEPQAGCRFSLPDSDLQPGDYETQLLFGDAIPGSVVIGENGRLLDYVPVATLAAQDGVILSLMPQP